MPFDGTDSTRDYYALGKIERVIDLLSSERRWCKGAIRTIDGRRCIMGALRDAGAERLLKEPILIAAREHTGRRCHSVESFNDEAATTHQDVLSVLRAVRSEVEAGRILTPSGPVRGLLYRIGVPVGA
jgi:hypothetical protein